MKNAQNITSSMRAARRQLRQACQRILAATDDASPTSELEPIVLANLRNDASEVGQRFHEFNAYHNVLFTE